VTKERQKEKESAAGRNSTHSWLVQQLA